MSNSEDTSLKIFRENIKNLGMGRDGNLLMVFNVMICVIHIEILGPYVT